MTGGATADGGALDALEGRSSVHGYLDCPVARPVVERILTAAARAPSGNNSQPWRVHVLTGSARTRPSDVILAAREADPAPDYDYYPQDWPEPYRSRRRTNGWGLYNLLGIQKGDKTKSRAWHDENFHFFSASVGLILTRDRRLSLGSLIDLGMFMEGLAVAARGLGLDTCPQAAFAHYHAINRRELRLAPEDVVICGMSLGYADMSVPANRLHTEREPVSGFAIFHSNATQIKEAH